ncbi:alpha/beta fold hydrolase [Nocardia aurantiaca]|uniref:Alpha/beta fold hydrolase n=1 Tax=Nocardia aurantiaca TaxID=2675850 RepID=A0A6I3KXQ1_9NOCA|nr:alpha/beta hydrolase [Nocardia aurantiaca]MTE14477.1 alpha/beta fold hydrolase [Nocardia aurantiaca]
MAEQEGDGYADSVVSEDGTRIAYLTTGLGPGVIVVPGVLSVARGYTRFAEALATAFTVHTIERRGHGGSGPQRPDHSIEDDCADLRALQDETGAAFVVGHGYGALVALEAARSNPVVRKVAVYEPALSVNGSMPTAWMGPYEKYLAQGKPLDAFVEFVRAIGPEGMRKVPRWMFRRMLPRFMQASDTDTVIGQLPQNLTEHRQYVRLDGTYRNYAEITAEVLLLDGDRDRREWTASEQGLLASVIPHCERATVPGLDHFGIDKGDPERVAEVVGEFLSRS